MADPADGPALILQAALIAHLRADPGLVALVGARVHDEPPPDVAFPYIRLGHMDGTPLRMACHTDEAFTFAIEAHSRPVTGGRVEATRIAWAIRRALDGATLALPGYTLDWCDYLTQTVIRAGDGASHIATVAFEAAIGRAA